MATTTAPLRDYGSDPSPDWLGFDFDSHLRRLEIDGRAVNVLDIGNGPALLLIHGHNVCWQHWLEQISAFRHSHRVIAPDLPGFGESEAPRAAISIPAYARVLALLCEQLDIERTVVVGNSMGGLIAAELAIRSPELVERLVLVSAAGLSDRYIGLPAALIRHPIGVAVGRGLFASGPPSERLARTLARRPRGRTLALGLWGGRPAARADQLHPALVYELIRNASRPGAAAAAVALARHELRPRLSRIQAPTLIVWGDRDNLVPLHCAHEFERLIAGSRLIVYGDTGHNPMIERPARFNADLHEFLSA
jgi:pimeloyl-ACP methyl ester carboxylesterase